jgi:hypothetical protein
MSISGRITANAVCEGREKHELTHDTRGVVGIELRALCIPIKIIFIRPKYNL